MIQSLYFWSNLIGVVSLFKIVRKHACVYLNKSMSTVKLLTSAVLTIIFIYQIILIQTVFHFIVFKKNFLYLKLYFYLGKIWLEIKESSLLQLRSKIRSKWNVLFESNKKSSNWINKNNQWRNLHWWHTLTSIFILPLHWWFQTICDWFYSRCVFLDGKKELFRS